MANKCGVRVALCWLALMVCSLVGRSARAQDLQYSAIDRATVRVLALGLVDLKEIEDDGVKRKLAAPLSGHGSGVVVAKEGLIVTAAHVVAGARAVAIHAPGVLGPLPARVVAIDETRDVALLRVPHTFETAAALGGADEALSIRQTVFAIGYPLDATRSDPQSSRGSVSGKLPDGRLQLDISVNPGNSGGPVVDERDRVFGIISARGNLEQGIVGLAVAVPLSAFRAPIETELSAPKPVAAGVTDRQVADLVSLVTHEGSSIMRGSVQQDSDDAERAERQVRQLVESMPRSADAALLGAAFFWNRHVAQQVKGNKDDTSLSEAERLAKRAVEVEPALAQKSRFVKFMLSSDKGAVTASTTAVKPKFGGTGHLIRFANAQKDAVLHVKVGEAEVTASAGLNRVVFNASSYEKLCDLPCEVKLPSGKYQFAVSQGGPMVPVTTPITVGGPTTLEAQYQSRKGVRGAGVGLIVAGSAVGAAIMLLAPNKDCKTGEFGFEECNYHMTGILVGGAIMIGGSLIGVIMLSQPDTAAVGAPGSFAPPQKAVSRSWPRPIGLSLQSTF